MLDDAKHGPRLETGAKSLSQRLRRLILDMDDDGKAITRPIGKGRAALGPKLARRGRDHVAMRIRAGVPQMIRQGIELVGRKVVLGALGRFMQPIERQLAVVGKVALPKPVPSQHMKTQALSRLGQLQYACVGPHVSRCFQVFSETQGGGRREPQSTRKVQASDGASFMLGAANLLERIFPKYSLALPAPSAAEFDRSCQKEDPDKKS
jgi:hypothetical protein